jgi:hypothetical protein
MPEIDVVDAGRACQRPALQPQVGIGPEEEQIEFANVGVLGGGWGGNERCRAA